VIGFLKTVLRKMPEVSVYCKYCLTIEKRMSEQISLLDRIFKVKWDVNWPSLRSSMQRFAATPLSASCVELESLQADAYLLEHY
jgi:hypothetical protein